MSIPSFPTSIPQPKPDFSGSIYLPQIRDEFDNGYVSTRKRFTKSREKLSGFGWNYLTEAQYQILEAFFISVQGGVFYWTSKVTNKTYLVGSASDELKYTFIPGGGRSVEWPLEERA